ncbi:unnamed protein product [Prunus armeniaca]
MAFEHRGGFQNPPMTCKGRSCRESSSKNPKKKKMMTYQRQTAILNFSSSRSRRGRDGSERAN